MNAKKIKKTFKSCGHAYRSIDMYGEKVELNFKEDDTINSHAGSTVSLVVSACMIAFTCYRLILLVTYGDTSVTENSVTDYFSSNYTFDFEANNFKIAVGLVSQDGLTPLLNPEIIDF